MRLRHASACRLRARSSRHERDRPLGRHGHRRLAHNDASALLAPRKVKARRLPLVLQLHSARHRHAQQLEPLERVRRQKFVTRVQPDVGDAAVGQRELTQLVGALHVIITVASVHVKQAARAHGAVGGHHQRVRVLHHGGARPAQPHLPRHDGATALEDGDGAKRRRHTHGATVRRVTHAVSNSKPWFCTGQVDFGRNGALCGHRMDEQILADEPLVLRVKGTYIGRVVYPERHHCWSPRRLGDMEGRVPVGK
mmetsp:Transcript_4492/g.9812  ORF Transcript_4492/g.9812 Transcript_4492/m.9812 type:complete len:253 (-) Transcript_4492:2254-3012(-)